MQKPAVGKPVVNTVLDELKARTRTSTAGVSIDVGVVTRVGLTNVSALVVESLVKWSDILGYTVSSILDSGLSGHDDGGLCSFLVAMMPTPLSVGLSPSSLWRISSMEGPSAGSSVTGSPCHGSPDNAFL